MARALALARKGIGVAHPNPCVGAVVVKDGRKVGEGFHSYDRRHHAEVIALHAAGAHAKGATLYVTLEPCCHTGRTGPCTEAIMEAGVKRVIAATADPNPLVAGKGFAQLRRAGIHILYGVLESEAREINEDFARWIQTGLPFVTLKTALSFDGRIAAHPGRSTVITGATSREEVQLLRHRADALLTGIGTVLADDPRLTDRTGLPRRRPLLRVVVDSTLRIPLGSKLVKSAKDDRLLIFTSESPSSRKARALARKGAEVVFVRGNRGRLDLKQILAELGRREMLSVLLEAGAELNGAALELGVVDKMILFYAPKLLGPGGVPLAVFRGTPHVPPLSNISTRLCGNDLVVEGYFHDVYRHHRARRKN
jgi:diaminohydroxyphosphoribosylaminopyrimidine deaminase/5-amino-6-(5-phosphoribosylamino)uracil reductase